MARQAKPNRRSTAAGKATEQIINIPRRDLRSMTVTIEGETPLITNAWSEVAITKISDKQNKTGQVKAAREPDQEYEDSIYRMPDGGHEMKAGAIKKAMIAAARYVQGITKTLATSAFHIPPGDLLPLVSAKPVMRMDTIKVHERASVALS